MNEALSNTITTPDLSILLVDSELELVPDEYWSHPAVVQNARKRNKRPSTVLLDSSLHHSIFKDPIESKRRGRPDIVHLFLLLGLDSILNNQGRLHLYVHTRNDELITVDPSTRLPKNYNRYSGLFEELFRSGSVPSGKKPLIILERNMDLKGSLDRIWKDLGSDENEHITVLLHPDGEKKDPWITFNEILAGGTVKHVLCLVGGFSQGDFSSAVEENSDLRISLPGGILKVWTVISELLVGFRRS